MAAYRFTVPVITACLLLPFFSLAQTTAKSATPADSMSRKSHVLRFSRSGVADPNRVVVNVVVRESIDRELVMGATVLLRRENPTRMYGKVTGATGACALTIAPDTYSVRVQVTGLASFEQSGFVLEPGSTYTLEIALAFVKKQ